MYVCTYAYVHMFACVPCICVVCMLNIYIYILYLYYYIYIHIYIYQHSYVSVQIDMPVHYHQLGLYLLIACLRRALEAASEAFIDRERSRFFRLAGGGLGVRELQQDLACVSQNVLVWYMLGP